MQWSQLSDIDNFFYYEDLSVAVASRHDVAVGALQPKRSLFYDREDSAGISEYENLPNGFFAEINLKYDIVNWIGRRNQVVGDGQAGSEDRRVAVSQSTIQVRRSGGNVDISILFLTLGDLNQPQLLNIPAGGGQGA